MTPAEYNALQDAIRKAWPATIKQEHQFNPRWIAKDSGAKHAKSVQAVFATLDKPRTVSQMMRKTGMSQQAIHYAVSKMVDNGWLHVTGRGGGRDPKVYSKAVKRLPRARA